MPVVGLVAMKVMPLRPPNGAVTFEQGVLAPFERLAERGQLDIRGGEEASQVRVGDGHHQTTVLEIDHAGFEQPGRDGMQPRYPVQVENQPPGSAPFGALSYAYANCIRRTPRSHARTPTLLPFHTLAKVEGWRRPTAQLLRSWFPAAIASIPASTVCPVSVCGAEFASRLCCYSRLQLRTVVALSSRRCGGGYREEEVSASRKPSVAQVIPAEEAAMSSHVTFLMSPKGGHFYCRLRLPQTRAGDHQAATLHY